MTTSNEEYTEKMQEVCSSCNHVRHLHSNHFPMISEGELMNKNESDGKCVANDCNCLNFCHQENSVA